MGRKRYSAEERAALLEQLSNREESLAGFARAHGVSVATLYHWQRQAGTAEVVMTDHFTEIRRADPGQREGQLTLRLGEATLQFEELPDASWLAALLQKLG